jgi:hypothetical protein
VQVVAGKHDMELWICSEYLRQGLSEDVDSFAFLKPTEIEQKLLSTQLGWQVSGVFGPALSEVHPIHDCRDPLAWDMPALTHNIGQGVTQRDNGVTPTGL